MNVHNRDVNLDIRTCVCANVNVALVSFSLSLSLYHILYVDVVVGTVITFCKSLLLMHMTHTIL